MKRIFCVLFLLLLLNAASAEEAAADLLNSVDLSGFDRFANENNAGFSMDMVHELLSDGDFPEWPEVRQTLIAILADPLKELSAGFSGMILPALMLSLTATALPGKYPAAAFICRIMLARSGAVVFALILQAVGECLETTSSFSNVAAPVLTALLTASGKTGSAALISPAAALAGNLIEKLFKNIGVPLCTFSGCIALCANLCETMALNRLSRLVKRLFNWGSGLALTLFTALIFLRGSAAELSDGLAVRTAKYAVDSVTPVIGSGVSDAWESYVSGLNTVRHTVGFSGAILLLSVCLKPMFTMAAAMIALSVLSSALEITGEKAAANCLDQLSGACQMALTLCGGAMAIWVILMGAMLSLGGGIL